MHGSHFFVLDFDDSHALAWTLLDHEPLRFERDHGTGGVIDGCSLVHGIAIASITKYAGEELEDAIDGVLLLLVLLARGEGLLPQQFIGILELVEIGGDGGLMAFDGGNAIHDRVDVEQLAGGDVGVGGGGGRCGIVDVSDVDGCVVCGLDGLLFALDETEHVGLSAVEVGMLIVPVLRICIGSENALLQMGYLVEAIHVELAHEGAEILVLEPATEDLFGEPLVVHD